MNTLMFAAECCDTTKCPFTKQIIAHPYLAVVLAFVLGVVVTIVLAKMFCPNCKKSHKCNCANKRADRSERAPRRDAKYSFEDRPVVPAGAVELYVGNLSYDLTEAALVSEFEKFGRVSSARVVTNRFNNKSKGFGFVVMPNREEAEKAIAAMNDKEFLGRKMRVNEAKNTIKEA